MQWSCVLSDLLTRAPLYCGAAVRKIRTPTQWIATPFRARPHAAWKKPITASGAQRSPTWAAPGIGRWHIETTIKASPAGGTLGRFVESRLPDAYRNCYNRCGCWKRREGIPTGNGRQPEGGVSRASGCTWDAGRVDGIRWSNDQLSRLRRLRTVRPQPNDLGRLTLADRWAIPRRKVKRRRFTFQDATISGYRSMIAFRQRRLRSFQTRSGRLLWWPRTRQSCELEPVPRLRPRNNCKRWVHPQRPHRGNTTPRPRKRPETQMSPRIWGSWIVRGIFSLKGRSTFAVA